MVLTAFINKPYNIIYSKSGGVKPRGLSGSDRRFQDVAQAPSGSMFTLVNAHGNLYKLDAFAMKITSLNIKLSYKHSLNSPDDFVAIATPTNDTIHACWVEHGMIVLTTFKGKNKPMRREIHRVNVVLSSSYMSNGG